MAGWVGLNINFWHPHCNADRNRFRHRKRAPPMRTFLTKSVHISVLKTTSHPWNRHYICAECAELTMTRHKHATLSVTKSVHKDAHISVNISNPIFVHYYVTISVTKATHKSACKSAPNSVPEYVQLGKRFFHQKSFLDVTGASYSICIKTLFLSNGPFVSTFRLGNHPCRPFHVLLGYCPQ